MVALVVFGLLSWDRVQRLRQRGSIPPSAGFPEAVARATVLAFLQALGAGWDAAVRAAVRQWMRGYSGVPPWHTTILAWIHGKGQTWRDRRRLERSGKHVEIVRTVDVQPRRRGRPPIYPQRVVGERMLPGWYARRLTGRPPGRPRRIELEDRNATQINDTEERETNQGSETRPPRS